MGDYKLFTADNAWQFLRFKRALTRLHLPFKIVTLHTAAGKRKAFRLSAATCVFLTTLHLVQPN